MAPRASSRFCRVGAPGGRSMTARGPAGCCPWAPRLDIAASRCASASLRGATDADIWRDAAGNVFARCRADGRGYSMDLPGLVALRFDREADRVVAEPHPGISTDAVR